MSNFDPRENPTLLEQALAEIQKLKEALAAKAWDLEHDLHHERLAAKDAEIARLKRGTPAGEDT